MPNPKTPPPGVTPSQMSDAVLSAGRRLNSMRELMDAFTVPATTGGGSVADLRTLTASSSTDDVRQFVITLTRDLKEI